MLIKEFINTEMEVIAETATIDQAAKMFHASGVVDMAVINSEGDFVGVLSQADLLRASMPDVEELYEANVSYRGLNVYFVNAVRGKAGTSIDRCIIRAPFTVDPDDPIVKAVTIMTNHRIASLPVVRDKKLLGVVTRTQVLSLFEG